MFCLSSVSLRVCQVLISVLTGERDEASLTHPMWVKNPDDFIYLFFLFCWSGRDRKNEKTNKNKTAIEKEKKKRSGVLPAGQFKKRN